jgi:DNA-binding GntR family transcriptional regulator
MRAASQAIEGAVVQGQGQPAVTAVPPRSRPGNGAGLNHATLAEQVCGIVRERILTNACAPGESLREEALAAEFSVSRVPVREALRQLAAEGLVDLVPRHGAIVSSLSLKQFLDAYRVREALEVLAVRLATPLLGEEGLARLRELESAMESCAERGDQDGFFAANTEFHQLLVERAANDDLTAMHAPLTARMRRYQSPSLDLRGGMARSLEEHRAIIDAIARGDAHGAASLLGEHIRVPQRTLEAMAARGEDHLPLRPSPGG